MQNFAWSMPVDGWFAVSWSLTIEEWFYLLFSGLLLALAAKANARQPLCATIRWLSTRSYCIYVVHLSLLQLAWGNRVVDRYLADALALLATLVMAELSFRYFETAIMRRRPLQFTQSTKTLPSRTISPAELPGQNHCPPSIGTGVRNRRNA